MKKRLIHQMDSVEESLRKFLRSSDLPLFQEDGEKNRKRLNFSCFHYFNYTNEDADALWLNIQVTWEICWKISKVKITREVDLWAGKRWQLLRWEMGRRIEERLGKGLKRKMGTEDRFYRFWNAIWDCYTSWSEGDRFLIF